MSKREISYYDQLKKLCDLQTIDHNIDLLESKRGGLPHLIADIQDAIQACELKEVFHHGHIEAAQKAIQEQQEKKQTAEAFLQKYESSSVDNPEEYESLGEELDIQKVEVLLTQKRIREHQCLIEREQEMLKKVKEEAEEKESLLASKEQELEEVNKESKEEQQVLEKKREKTKKGLQKDLLDLYEILRRRMQRVVVNVVDKACNGCFILVPPQVQIDIKEQKRMVRCENCGRILARVEVQEAVSGRKRTSRRKKA